MNYYYQKMTLAPLAMVLLACTQVNAGTNASCGVSLPKQAPAGSLIIGRANAGSVLTLAGRKLQLAPDLRFVFGAGPDVRQMTLAVRANSCKANVTVMITPRTWKTEIVNGVPQNTVTPDPATQKRIQAEGALISKARALESAGLGWQQPLIWPAIGRISGIYGSRRIINGQPSSPHLGLDIAAPTGTIVKAALSGKVSLRHDDMVMTGKTLILDHGFGINTVYIHLSQINVIEGQEVSAGDKIGAIGTSGRSTGPHLHFQVQWFQEKLDPALVLPGLFK